MMKKLLALFVLLSMSFTTCFASTTLFPDGSSTLASSFTDKIVDDDHYVKYDAATDSVISYATSSSNCQGTLTFPLSYTSDGVTVAFTAKANSAIHSRTRMYFKDGNGTQILAMQASSNGTNFYIADTGLSRFDRTFADKAIGEEIRVEVKFDFTNATYTLRLGQKLGDGWSFNSWIAEKALTAGSAGLKTMVISNEWALSDASIYDIEVTKPEDEQPVEDNYENPIYERVLKEDFSGVSKNISSNVADSDHYVAVDETAGNFHAYNGNGSGGQTATIKLDNTITADGSKLAFTFNSTEKHKRMKIQFLNSEGKQIHTSFVLRINNSENVGITDKGSSLVADENKNYLYNAKYGTPVRIEMEFNFTNRTITYRAAEVTDSGYKFKPLAVTKDFLPESAGASVFNISSLQVQNAYVLCDATLDDIEIYVPKLSVVKSEANTDEYLVTYTIQNNTAEAITADIICAVYKENGALDEVKSLKGANIDGSLSDMFMFDIAEDVSRYKIFIWNKLDDNVPVSMGYKSF